MKLNAEAGTSAYRPKTFSKKKQEVYDRRQESIEEERDEEVEKTVDTTTDLSMLVLALSTWPCPHIGGRGEGGSLPHLEFLFF